MTASRPNCGRSALTFSLLKPAIPSFGLERSRAVSVCDEVTKPLLETAEHCFEDPCHTMASAHDSLIGRMFHDLTIVFGHHRR